MRATILIEIPPAAEVVAEFELGLATAHSVHHFHGADFIRINTFAVQIELTPKEEEFLAHLMADIAINDCVPLIVLMNDIESLAVPNAQVEALSIHNIIAEDSLQLVYFGF